MFAVLFAHFLYVSTWLVYPDLVLNYPYMGGDSQDWLANGLYYLGHDVSYSARPPLLPLLVAALERLGALSLLPVILQALFHGTAAALFVMFSRDYSRLVAASVSAYWVLNGTWFRSSLQILADVPAACLLALGLVAWRLGKERPGYIAAGTLVGLSAVTQQLALLTPVAVLLTEFRFRPRAFAQRAFWVGTGLFVLPTAVWLAFKYTATGTVGDVQNRHWSLLGLHFDSIGYYAFSTVAVFGVPACVAIGVGAVSFVKRARGDSWCFLVVALALLAACFFVFLYTYDSFRFVAYLFPCGVIFLAEGLSKIGRAWPAATVAAAAAVLLWSLYPLPGLQPRADRILLWPAPSWQLTTVVRRVGTDARIDTGRFELERAPAPNLSGLGRYRELAARRAQPLPSRGLAPQAFETDRWAVYLYEADSLTGPRNAVVHRLGNLLRKRVRSIPFGPFRELSERADFERLGTLDGSAIYRARLPHVEGSWIVAVDAGAPSDRVLRASPSASPGNPAELKLAERVAGQVGREAAAVLFSDPDLESWQLYLPFLLDSRDLLVIEPSIANGARRMLGEGEPDRNVDGVEARRHEVFGQSYIVIGGKE